MPIEQYEYLQQSRVPFMRSKTDPNQCDWENVAKAINESVPHDDQSYVRFIVCQLELSEAPDNWRQSLQGSVSSLTNQAVRRYADSAVPIRTHDGLVFRSHSETVIYDELKSRGVLVLPLPAAVLGNSGKKLEPDFVVVHQGKVGILEVHGEPWHPPERATEEANRRRELRNFGIEPYDTFDAKLCRENPKWVVDQFLKQFG